MTTLTKTGLLTLAAFAFMGCETTNTSDQNSLKTLDRDVSYLTDTNGMSLYIFDKDGLNQSNCDAGCQEKWPLFEGANTASTDIKVLEGTDHLAYRKHPLYSFFKDQAVGDVKGDNVKNVWHLVYAPVGSTDSQTQLSEQTMTQTYLTDAEGRTLYTFDNDTDGVSNCYGGCEDVWPVYYNTSVKGVPKGLSSSDFTTISRDTTRSEESKQTAYKGKPLYYFTPDEEKSGATKGDWVKGLWDVVEISAH